MRICLRYAIIIAVCLSFSAYFLALNTLAQNTVGSTSSNASKEMRGVPIVFAEGIVSTGDNEFAETFTPDGKTVYFSKSAPDRDSPFVILFSRFEKGRWMEPEIASFSGRYSDADPFISPDGSKLVYMSKRPVSGEQINAKFDLWMVEKNGAGWGEPKHFDAPVNSDADETTPSLSAAGTLYFASNRAGGKGASDIYRSRLVNGQYTQAENLGDAINTEVNDSNAFISPDGSYLIFASTRTGGNGEADLYISYNRNEAWTPPRKLGNVINSKSDDYTPIVSPDGKYLFFTSRRRTASFPNTIFDKRISFQDLSRRLRSAGNGQGDIYQISTSALPTAP